MGKTIIRGVTRREFITRAAGVAAATAITAAAEAQSLEKSAVEYRGAPQGQECCGGCAFWQPDATTSGRNGSCSMVIGEVDADAWCAIWAPAA